MKPGDCKSVLQGNVIAFVWRDKREVRMVTNIDGYGMRLVETRRGKIPKPIAVIKYNEFMKGVDKGDQFSSYYIYDHRYLRWWKRIFITIIDIAVMNSFILFKETMKSSLTQLAFREHIIKEIFHLSTFQKNPLLYAPGVKRLSTEHDMGTRKQKNCSVCSTTNARVTTTFYCMQCEVNVCPTPCWKILHTLLFVLA